jgi:hypothetical protein
MRLELWVLEGEPRKAAEGSRFRKALIVIVTFKHTRRPQLTVAHSCAI